MIEESRRPPLYWLYAGAFTVSGFSGLVYESIWTHYLKLFLGSAAYAQTLVLAIFMGGMAFGAWGAGRLGKRITHLLPAYALLEGIIGLMGLIFHDMFVGITGAAFGSIFPALGSMAAVGAAKWSLAALMILPQSALLGATFPLMSAGIIRRFPAQPGRSLAMLYFANSLGAAAGALASGFILIKAVGLPGTVLAAGLLNLAVAAVVWLAARGDKAVAAAAAEAQAPQSPGPARLTLALACAALTGLASFMYEIGWIRMLSMVLGSSSHAFELMLSAFILGLALGGYFIRGRADAPGRALYTLGLVQVAMGILAIGTVFIYGSSFEFMRFMMGALAKNDEGYILFNIASHAAAMGVMLPATICAGMTLPLLTVHMLRHGGGEASIGAVYAANTAGAIAGVALGVQVVMPLLGLKNLILLGAAVDMAVGVWLLSVSETGAARKRRVALASALAAAAVALAMGKDFDRLKMVSGVYRTGQLLTSGAQILFHQDGKTASVDVIVDGLGTDGTSMGILTNGKPDSSVGIKRTTEDEPTMLLLPILSWDIYPSARRMAIIGIGTGVSTHMALTIPELEKVDTIEIEPAMVAGARLFGQASHRAFTDPRGQIHIEDAKTFFATRPERYGLIISEPSNPWVSGVAGLFTSEFYATARRSLADGGVFAQWMQLYEMDLELLSSVIRALSPNFEDYAFYLTNSRDLLIVARKGAMLDLPHGEIFKFEESRAALARVGITGMDDLLMRRLGGKKVLDPFFSTYGLNANSDYFPVLDQGAARARFLRASASDIALFRGGPVPVAAMLEGLHANGISQDLGKNRHLELGAKALRAREIAQSLSAGEPPGAEPEMAAAARMTAAMADHCSAPASQAAMIRVINATAYAMLPYLSSGEMDGAWARLSSGRCFAAMPLAGKWLALHRAVGRRDFSTAGPIAASLLPEGNIPPAMDNIYLAQVAALSMILRGEGAQASKLLGRLENFRKLLADPNLRLLAAAASGQSHGGVASRPSGSSAK